MKNVIFISHNISSLDRQFPAVSETRRGCVIPFPRKAGPRRLGRRWIVDERTGHLEVRWSVEAVAADVFAGSCAPRNRTPADSANLYANPRCLKAA
jgi:hypothetical protein